MYKSLEVRKDYSRDFRQAVRRTRRRSSWDWIKKQNAFQFFAGRRFAGWFL